MSEILLEPRWTDRLDTLVARRREAIVVAAVITLSLAVILLLRARAGPAAIAPPAVLPSVAASGPGAATVGQASVVIVHVAGAVRHPGLYELPLGSRIADAIEAAGGPRVVAWLDGLNLAQVLADGMKIDVLRLGRRVGLTTPPASPPRASQPGLVNLNTADQATLETIPGVGPVTASAILEHRARSGGFSAVEDLLEVSGIGPATLESIRPYVTV
ncbi:MAG: helix-hairpin-helix domain-containing protein [Actinomycetota bacterium]